jgi:hypothetical protein
VNPTSPSDPSARPDVAAPVLWIAREAANEPVRGERSDHSSERSGSESMPYVSVPGAKPAASLTIPADSSAPEPSAHALIFVGLILIAALKLGRQNS